MSLVFAGLRHCSQWFVQPLASLMPSRLVPNVHHYTAAQIPNICQTCSGCLYTYIGCLICIIFFGAAYIGCFFCHQLKFARKITVLHGTQYMLPHTGISAYIGCFFFTQYMPTCSFYTYLVCFIHILGLYIPTILWSVFYIYWVKIKPRKISGFYGLGILFFNDRYFIVIMSLIFGLEND